MKDYRLAQSDTSYYWSMDVNAQDEQYSTLLYLASCQGSLQGCTDTARTLILHVDFTPCSSRFHVQNDICGTPHQVQVVS
jgi:hypothetical protein